MALVNAKALRSALKTFFKENGRDPDFEEFRRLVSGESLKKKDIKNDQEKPENKEESQA